METKKLELSPSCSFEYNTYEHSVSDMTLDYTEYSSDHYYSDRLTSTDISKELAQEIISFLSQYVNEGK